MRPWNITVNWFRDNMRRCFVTIANKVKLFNLNERGYLSQFQIVFPDFLQNPALISSSAAAAAAAAAAAVVEAGSSWINEGKINCLSRDPI